MERINKTLKKSHQYRLWKLKTIDSRLEGVVFLDIAVHLAQEMSRAIAQCAHKHIAQDMSRAQEMSRPIAQCAHKQ